MAAIFIVAGLAIADKVEKKKEAKRQKKANDEARYRELQIETNRRLARRESGNVIENPLIDYTEEDEEDDEYVQSAVDEAKPPAYEDAVQVGERREREWQAQMQRRRSSTVSNQGNNNNNAAASTYMRMG